MVKTAYLLTGMPGAGKTTLIKKVLQSYGGKAGGFFTEEIREAGTRLGFNIVTLDGRRVILAHIKIRSDYLVSKYSVDISGLEDTGLDALEKARDSGGLVVLDEIGKMELFSQKFKSAVITLLESRSKILGTIMLKPDPWADRIKVHPRVKLLSVTRSNHEAVLDEIQGWLSGRS